MLYQHVKTGARVKVVSEWDDGDWFMIEDQDGRVFTAYKTEVVPDEKATKKVKTLQVKDAAAKEEIRKFPPETRLNINSATAQMIAGWLRSASTTTFCDFLSTIAIFYEISDLRYCIADSCGIPTNA